MKSIADLVKEIEAQNRALNVMMNRTLTRPDVMLRIINDMSFAPFAESPSSDATARRGVPVELSDDNVHLRGEDIIQ